VPENSLMGGQRLTKRSIKAGLQWIKNGECDAAVMSISVGGAGLNCQSMNAMVFMAPPTSDSLRKQAKGIFSDIVY
jgi:hypothetical protein